ncbi:MAG: hypothetical protein ACYCPW_02050 [Nitrososphaerales archaeon]
MENESQINIVCIEIDSMRQECLQIAELLKLEGHYLREVINQFKQIIMPLNVSLPLNRATLPRNDFSISDAVLTSEGIVCALSEGKVLYRIPLDEFQTETVLRIIEKALPQVRSLINDSQEKPSERLSSIEKISKELRKIISGERLGDRQNSGRTQ